MFRLPFRLGDRWRYTAWDHSRNEGENFTPVSLMHRVNCSVGICLVQRQQEY